MTEEKQVSNISNMGYSESEARFLVKAALHSGYFLRRQFSPNRGRASYVLCQRLLALKHARVSQYYRRAEVYHLGSKPFYFMLGEPDNRHRRDRDIIDLRSKLMGLDYVLSHPEWRFLATEDSKVEYFCGELGIDRMELPGQVYKDRHGAFTKRNFVEKYPIYINPDGVVGLCYLDDGMYTRSTFAPWLARHRSLIQALGAKAEIVYVASEDSGFAAAEREYRRIFTTVPPELSRFLAMRAEAEAGGLEARPIAWLEAYRELFARWGHQPSQIVTPAVTGFRTEVLPYSYKALPSLDQTTLARPGEAFATASTRTHRP